MREPIITNYDLFALIAVPKGDFLPCNKVARSHNVKRVGFWVVPTSGTGRSKVQKVRNWSQERVKGRLRIAFGFHHVAWSILLLFFLLLSKPCFRGHLGRRHSIDASLGLKLTGIGG